MLLCLGIKCFQKLTAWLFWKTADHFMFTLFVMRPFPLAAQILKFASRQPEITKKVKIIRTESKWWFVMYYMDWTEINSFLSCELKNYWLTTDLIPKLHVERVILHSQVSYVLLHSECGKEQKVKCKKTRIQGLTSDHVQSISEEAKKKKISWSQCKIFWSQNSSRTEKHSYVKIILVWKTN